MEHKKLSFGKAEKLCGIKAINELFDTGRTIHTPLFRVVYAIIPANDTHSPSRLLVSVPKRHFRNAVTRNLIRRRIKEAYRKNKKPLLTLMKEKNCYLHMAIVWKESKTATYSEIELSMIDFMTRLSHLG